MLQRNPGTNKSHPNNSPAIITPIDSSIAALPVDSGSTGHDDLASLVAVGHRLLELAERQRHRILELESAAARHRGVELEVFAGNVVQRELTAVTAEVTSLLNTPAELGVGAHSAEEVGKSLAIDCRSVGHLATTRKLKDSVHFYDPRSRSYTDLGLSLVAALQESRRGRVDGNGASPANAQSQRSLILAHVLESLRHLTVIGDRRVRVERDVRRQVGADVPRRGRKKAQRSQRTP